MEPEKKSNGALVGAVIIILILLVGGIYMWKQRAETLPAALTEEVAPADTEELDLLEQDLNAIDTEIEANVIEAVE